MKCCCSADLFKAIWDHTLICSFIFQFSKLNKQHLIPIFQFYARVFTNKKSILNLKKYFIQITSAHENVYDRALGWIFQLFKSIWIVNSSEMLPTSCWLVAWDPEDGGSICLWNIGELLLDYTVSHPKGQYSSVFLKLICTKLLQYSTKNWITEFQGKNESVVYL